MSLEIVLAAPFRHMRKERLQKNDFVFYLALDRKWMNREQATVLLERAITKGLFSVADGWITPQFDVQAVTIPLGYRPPADLLLEEEPAQTLLARIASKTNRPLNEITAEMNQLITRNFGGVISIEAASVILAKKYGISFEDLLDSLKEQVAKKK
ncbi:MAG: DUF2240 family protein [Methanomicrobiales archaeon]|nr:DUF2240 family protein [Methanomicrobiales archaeon]